MKLGVVKDKIWATKKSQALAGYKLLVVEVCDDKQLIAADTLDAGIGDQVIVVGGSSARVGQIPQSLPIDATIIAIVDKKPKN